MKARYIVYIELGSWFERYRGNNYNRAVQIANFWDERVNVRLVDTGLETAYGRAMRRFDEAIARLA